MAADVKLCSSVVGEFTTLKEGPLQTIVDTSTVDYTTVSGEVSSFAAKLQVEASTFSDVGLQAAWQRVAANGDAAAQVLLDQDTSTSLTALTKFIAGTTAAIQQCTVFIKAATP